MEAKSEAEQQNWGGGRGDAFVWLVLSILSVTHISRAKLFRHSLIAMEKSSFKRPNQLALVACYLSVCANDFATYLYLWVVFFVCLIRYETLQLFIVGCSHTTYNNLFVICYEFVYRFSMNRTSHSIWSLHGIKHLLRICYFFAPLREGIFLLFWFQ